LAWVGCQVVELVLVGTPHRIVKIVAMSRVDDTESFICVVLAEAHDFAVVEGEAVFPFREPEAPELNVDVLTSLARFFCSQEGRGIQWDGATIKVWAWI
jgi:hypothetical protein